MAYRGIVSSSAPQYKSQGERKIGRFLDSRGIGFQYEYPLAIQDRGQTRIWYPDFRLPEYGGTIIEYFGMNGNPAYDQQMYHKITTYKEAGINGIYLVETSFDGDWQNWILDRIEGTLEQQLKKISSIKQSVNPATPTAYTHSSK